MSGRTAPVLVSLLPLLGMAAPCLGRGDDDPAGLPRLRIDEVRYVGALRVPDDDYGGDNGNSFNYAEGPIAYDAASHSLFVVGHTHEQRITQIVVPALVESSVFPSAFAARELGGGSFDPASGLLYLTLLGADREQGTYSYTPLVAVYRFAPTSLFADGFEGGVSSWSGESP